MIFRFSALYPYVLDDIKFYLHLSLIFRLLPKKIDTVKNIAKKTANNSERTPSKNKKHYVKFNK